MKKLFSLLLLTLAVTSMQAQQTINLGYCGGEATTKGSVSTPGKAWVSAAIYLPADLLASFDGSSITALRGALASKINVDTLRLWVRSSLKGENLAEATVTSKTDPKLARGWNEVALDKPYVIDGSQGLYVGLSYRQKAEVQALSIVGAELANACFVQLGDDAPWQDMSSAGILSVEAVVDGSNMPDYDLGLTSAVANPYLDASNYQLTVGVVNNGQQHASGFTLETRYAQSDEVYTQHFSTDLATGQKTTVDYQIPARSTVSNGDIIVSLTAMDGAADEVSGNNTIKAKFTLKKKVLIEEYTTEPCGNCPRVAGYLHNVLAMPQYEDKAIAVCHHSGYKTDWLTKSCDETLASFFGAGYAPAVMYDRSPVLVDGALHDCPEQMTIEQAVAYLSAQPAHVTIAFSAAYDATAKQLSVTVSGKRDELNLTNPLLTVYLVENDIRAVNQASGGSNFRHQHVIRAYNSNFGDAMQWDGNQYENHFTFDVKDEWVKENMQIVAFVANYDSKNNKNCVVDNVELTGFPTGSTQGIATTANAADGATADYFTLDGRRADAAPRGLLIVRQQDGQGHVHTYKTIRN